MEPNTPLKCPACSTALSLNPHTKDFDCQGCDRSWYEATCEGDPTLRRKVQLRDPKKTIEEVSPSPEASPTKVTEGLMRVLDGCEVLIQFGSPQDRESATLLLFHVYREFRLVPRPSHADLITEMGARYGSMPGKPPADAEARLKFTCNKCAANLSCHYAWDEYNQGGDCLAEH